VKFESTVAIDILATSLSRGSMSIATGLISIATGILLIRTTISE